MAFDHGENMVELAKRRLGDRAEIRLHDLAKPLAWLEDDTFDLALMALVLHLLDDRVAALAEIHRVLRPGGRLVVSTHHPMVDWMRRGGGRSWGRRWPL